MFNLADFIKNILNFRRKPRASIPGAPEARPNALEDEGLNILARVMTIGFGVMAIVALCAIDSHNRFATSLRIFGLSAVTGFVAAAVGGLLGFLFGIPLSKQGNASGASQPAATNSGRTEQPNAGSRAKDDTYGNNTNLEQISDWLTKIIVGVSLTQLPKLQVYFDQQITIIANGMKDYIGPSYAKPYAGCLLIFYAITGFLFVYLWAKIYLKAQLVLNDHDM